MTQSQRSDRIVKVLNGANPGDPPVELSGEFALVVNLSIAREIWLRFLSVPSVRRTRGAPSSDGGD